MLDQLNNSDGDLWTMELLAGPAIDLVPPGANGCGTAITTDQRGSYRPKEAGCEAGAFEGAYAGVYVPLAVRQY